MIHKLTGVLFGTACTFAESQRIGVTVETDDEMKAAIEAHRDYVTAETLAIALDFAPCGAETREVQFRADGRERAEEESVRGLSQTLVWPLKVNPRAPGKLCQIVVPFHREGKW